MRVTRANVEGMLIRAHRAAFLVGFSGEPVTLEAGSETYGRAWSVYRPNRGQTPAWLDGVALGRTARSAYDALHTVAVTLENVHYLTEQSA